MLMILSIAIYSIIANTEKVDFCIIDKLEANIKYILSIPNIEPKNATINKSTTGV